MPGSYDFPALNFRKEITIFEKEKEDLVTELREADKTDVPLLKTLVGEMELILQIETIINSGDVQEAVSLLNSVVAVI